MSQVNYGLKLGKGDYVLTKIGVLYEDQLSGYLSMKQSGKLEKDDEQLKLYNLSNNMSTTELIVLSVLTFACESITGSLRNKSFECSDRVTACCFSDGLFTPRSFYRSMLGLSLRVNDRGFRLIEKEGNKIRLFTQKFKSPVTIVKLDIINRKLISDPLLKFLYRPSFILALSFILHLSNYNYKNQSCYYVSEKELCKLPQGIGMAKRSIQNACTLLMELGLMRGDSFKNLFISEDFSNEFKKISKHTAKVNMMLLEKRKEMQDKSFKLELFRY